MSAAGLWTHLASQPPVERANEQPPPEDELAERRHATHVAVLHAGNVRHVAAARPASGRSFVR